MKNHDYLTCDMPLNDKDILTCKVDVVKANFTSLVVWSMYKGVTKNHALSHRLTHSKYSNKAFTIMQQLCMHE